MAVVEAPAVVDAPAWPEKAELERWLMNTAKDGDEGATFLRKMLHMNPGYGSFLAGDESLSQIVQAFAKRFRNKILGVDPQSLRSDPSGKMLYEPLCEVSWRVVGHVLHGIVELEDADNYPVSKEALGQVKMLLNTNIALSSKFNEMRRAYLRELSVYRDKQRHIDEHKLAAINSLQEDPIMFYEPLSFVLDDTTKQFVNEVIEERLKLGMKVQSKPPPEVPPEPAETEDPEKERLKMELRQLRAQAARDQASAERYKEEAARAKAALEKMTGEKDEIIERLEREVEALKKQRAELNKELQARRSKDAPEEVVESPTSIVREEVFVDNSSEFEDKIKAQEEEMERMRARIKELEKEKKDQQREMDLMRQEMDELEAKANKPREAKLVEVEPKKPKREKKDTGNSELEQLRQQLADAMKVEKELRSANRALEKALEEAKEKAKYRGPQGDGKNVDDEIAKAIAKITEQHKKQLKAKDEEIEKLRDQLDAEKKRNKAKEEPEQVEKKPRKVKEPVVVDDEAAGKAREWKRKHDELLDKYDELEHEYEKLQHQLRIVLDKLKKYGGDAALEEVMAEAKITALPPRKKRRKKAWERLYEDAQRRILEMTIRRKDIEKQEKKLLISAASRVTDRKGLRQVENLTHLHKASVATQHRFHDALQSFHKQNTVPIAEGNEESATSGDEGGRLLLTMGSSSPGTTLKPGSPLTGPLGSSNPVPTAVAEEFHRLRAENRLLMQELGRLRGIVPNSAPAGPGAEAPYLGMSTMPLGTKELLRKAETGISLGGSLGGAIQAVSFGMGLAHQSERQGRGPLSKEAQRSSSNSRSSSPDGPGPRGSLASSLRSAAIGAALRQAPATMGRLPPSPQHDRSQSRSSSRSRDVATPISAPRRQAPQATLLGSSQGSASLQACGYGTAVDFGRTVDFSRSGSAAQLFGTAPHLGGAVPWRASTPPSPPPPPGAALAPPPAGYGSPKVRAAGAGAAAHEQAPPVLGRVPSAPVLQPIGGRPGSRQLVGSGDSPARPSSSGRRASGGAGESPDRVLGAYPGEAEMAAARAAASAFGPAPAFVTASLSSTAPVVADMAAARATAPVFGSPPAFGATGLSYSSAVPVGHGAGHVGALAATAPPGSMVASASNRERELRRRHDVVVKHEEPKPLPTNFLSGPVKPKARGLCITPLRSQQHLSSLGDG